MLPKTHPLRCQSIEHSKVFSAPPPAARLCRRPPLARGGDCGPSGRPPPRLAASPSAALVLSPATPPRCPPLPGDTAASACAAIPRAWLLASTAAVARSPPGAPKKHRKQVITGGIASRRGIAPSRRPTPYSMCSGKVIARFARRRRPRCFMRTLRRREPRAPAAHCC